MIADFEAGPRDPLDQVFDVCVVGTGPAGITVARRLAGLGATVALMEGGGLELDARSQELYEGENRGLEYFTLDTTRLRCFGGSSNHWGGMCRLLDDHDFEPKPRNPLSGWPIAKRDLDPYRTEADAVLNLMPGGVAQDLPFRDPSYRFERVQFRFSEPTPRFGEKYREEIGQSDRIHLFVNANLVDIRLTDDLGSVEALVFRSYAKDDPGMAVRARYYVLCLGGLENPRALLNADSQAPNGVGNTFGLVGRFFSEHPHYVIADVLFEDPQLRPTVEMDFFSPTPAFLDENACLNFNLRLIPNVIRQEPTSPLKELIRGTACVAPFSERLAWRVLGRSLHCEKGGFAEVFAGGPPEDEDVGVLQITCEQALNPESRVVLSDARDALGLRRAALDWRLTDLDFETMRTAGVGLGSVFAETGAARVRLRDWLLAEAPQLPGLDTDEVGGHHQMCTTRMSDDPTSGVVNRDCRVHGVSNLYMGGSSCFATGGSVNPTYTIVQLALRLGDHLSRELGGA